MDGSITFAEVDAHVASLEDASGMADKLIARIEAGAIDQATARAILGHEAEEHATDARPVMPVVARVTADEVIADYVRGESPRDPFVDLGVLLDEVYRLRAANRELTEDYVPMVGSDFLTFVDGVPQVTMTGARKVIARLAESMALMLDDAKAENYVEIDAVTAGGKKFTLRIQRGGHPTPHELRTQADARAAELEVELAADRKAIGVLGAAVGKVNDLHQADEDGFCRACQTALWPCATAKAIGAGQ